MIFALGMILAISTGLGRAETPARSQVLTQDGATIRLSIPETLSPWGAISTDSVVPRYSHPRFTPASGQYGCPSPEALEVFDAAYQAVKRSGEGQSKYTNLIYVLNAPFKNNVMIRTNTQAGEGLWRGTTDVSVDSAQRALAVWNSAIFRFYRGCKDRSEGFSAEKTADGRILLRSELKTERDGGYVKSQVDVELVLNGDVVRELMVHISDRYADGFFSGYEPRSYVLYQAAEMSGAGAGTVRLQGFEVEKLGERVKPSIHRFTGTDFFD